MKPLLPIGGAILFAYFFGEWVGGWLGRTFTSMAGWSYWPGVALAGYIGFHVGEAAHPSSWREDAPPDTMTPKKILSCVGAVAAAWFYGPQVGQALAALFPKMTINPKWPGIIAALVVGYAGGGLIGETLQRKRVAGFSRGGGWDLILRPVKGAIAEGAVVAVLIFVYAFALGYTGITSLAQHIDAHVFGIDPVMPGPAFLALLLPAMIFAAEDRFPALLRWIARALRWPRRMLRVAGFGKGGAGAFGTLLDEWECLYKRGDILLGASSYNKKQKIGLKDDRHLLTIAATGGGKGRSAIIPNLLLWPHSALVIDPKGTNAAVTALTRGNGGGRVKNFMGQAVHVVDPFGVLRAQGIDIESARLNPLAALDMDSPTIFEDIAALADALVVSTSKDPHWDNKTRSLIAGAIAHVISTYPPEHRTLITVRDMLLGASPDEFKKTLENMVLNPMAAGLARETALDILRAEGSEEMRNVYSNVQKSLAWLLSPGMRRTLSRSDFSLRDLQEKPTTVYLVLPPEELATHARFLRVFVAAGLRTMMKREPDQPRKRPVLFVLDEFLALGRMDSVLSAMNVVRNYGIKIWPIVQNVNGLVDLYGQNWHTFVDAAGAVQVFSIAGKPSAEFLAERLGHQVIARATPGGVQVMPVALRSGPELQEETDRDWGKQIVLRAGKKPLFLNRTPYDKRRYFWKAFYSPDPDHPGS